VSQYDETGQDPSSLCSNCRTTHGEAPANQLTTLDRGHTRGSGRTHCPPRPAPGQTRTARGDGLTFVLQGAGPDALGAAGVGTGELFAPLDVVDWKYVWTDNWDVSTVSL
jgi:hypothetical protein